MKTQTIKKNSKGPVSLATSQGGFTLVETLFAVFILTFVIVGLMTVVANSLFTARYERDEITANYLLQEVVDYVRNDRDTKVFLNGGVGAWDNFFGDYSNCSGLNGCYFNLLLSKPKHADIESCPITSIEGCSLSYDDLANTTPFYIATTDDTVTTKFKRKIIVGRIGDEITLTVTVYWKNGGIDRERILTTSLTNWQKNSN